VSLNFAGLGFSFAAKGANHVKKAFQGVTGAAGAALEILDGLTGTGEGLSHSIGTVLGGSLSLVVNLFKTLGSTALASGTILISAMALAGGAIGAVVDTFVSLVGFGPKMLKSFTGAFSAVSDQIQSLANAGQKLTSDLESEALSTSITVRQLGFTYGKAGKDLDKFTQKQTQSAMAMGIGATEAASAAYAWELGSEALKNLGFESEKQLMKFEAGAGISTQKLSDWAVSMDAIGIKADGIKAISGATLHYARTIGDVTGTLEKTDGLVDQLTRVRALNTEAFTSEAATQYAQSISSAGVAIYSILKNTGKAAGLVDTLSESLLSVRENRANLLAGTETDLSETTTALTVMLGSVDKAWEVAAGGPEAFVIAMTDVIKQKKAAGLWSKETENFFRGQLMSMDLSTVQAGELQEVFGHFGNEQIDLMEKNKKAVGGFGKAAEDVFRSSRTLQESFDLMKASMFQAFRNLGMPKARAWVDRQREAMEDFKQTLKSFKGDDSVLGQFVNKMSEASILGAQSLLPESMQTITTVAGAMLEQLSPTIDMLGKFGAGFGSISELATTGAMGLGLWAMSALKVQKASKNAAGDTMSFGDALVVSGRQWVSEVKGMLATAGRWFLDISKMFADFDWASLFGGSEQTEKSTSGIGALLAEAKDAFNQIKWGEIIDNLLKGFTKIWDAIATPANEQRFSAAMETVGTWFGKAMDLIVNKVPWQRVFETILRGGKAALGTVLAEVWSPGTVSNWLSDAFGETGNGGFTGVKDMQFDKDKKKADEFAKSLGGVKPADWFKGWFGGPDGVEKQAEKVNATLEKSVVLPVDKAAAQAAQINSSLMSIPDGVEERHSNSMNTYIEKDMLQCADVVEKNAQIMSASLQQFAREGEDAFTQMWYGITQGTESAVNQISQIAERLVSNLEQIALMKATIADAASQSSDRFAIPAANEERNRRIEQLVGDKAVHSPLWYEGAGGYKDLFSTRMDRLIAAVEGLRFQTAPAAAGAAPKAPPKSFVPSPPPGGTRGVARTNSGSTPARR